MFLKQTKILHKLNIWLCSSTKNIVNRIKIQLYFLRNWNKKPRVNPVCKPKFFRTERDGLSNWQHGFTDLPDMTETRGYVNIYGTVMHFSESENFHREQEKRVNFRHG